MVWLIQHAGTDRDDQGRYHGWSAEPLSQTGRLEAAYAAIQLAGMIPPDTTLWASPLERTTETAEFYADVWHVNVNEAPGLLPLNLGMFAGSLGSDTGETIRHWVTDPMMRVKSIPQGEAPVMWVARFLDFVSPLVYDPRLHVCVTHSMCIGLARAVQWGGEAPNVEWGSISLKHTVSPSGVVLLNQSGSFDITDELRKFMIVSPGNMVEKGGPGSGVRGHHTERTKPSMVSSAKINPKEAENFHSILVMSAASIRSVLPAYSRETALTDLTEADHETRGLVKMEVVREISKTMGERDQYEARERVDLWAETSGDTEARPVLMQHAIREEFELNGAVVGHMMSQVDARNELIENDDRSARQLKDEHELDREFSRAEYENTQKYLGDKGVKYLSLYRGVQGSDLGLKAGDQVVNMQPASSWSIDPYIADNFANHSTPGTLGSKGWVLTTRVPASRVLSTCLTGRGCLTEGEVIVLGGRTHVNVVPSSKYGTNKWLPKK